MLVCVCVCVRVCVCLCSCMCVFVSTQWHFQMFSFFLSLSLFLFLSVSLSFSRFLSLSVSLYRLQAVSSIPQECNACRHKGTGSYVIHTLIHNIHTLSYILSLSLRFWKLSRLQSIQRLGSVRVRAPVRSRAHQSLLMNIICMCMYSMSFYLSHTHTPYTYVST